MKCDLLETEAEMNISVRKTAYNNALKEFKKCAQKPSTSNMNKQTKFSKNVSPKTQNQ
jgi:hypothetical protein